MRITDWVIGKLEPLGERPRVLLRDPHQLLAERDPALHEFAVGHGFTVITAATNLVFRELYQNALAAAGASKLLVIDRAPAARRQSHALHQAPAPFYPDLLAATPPEARIELDVRQLLRERTGDPGWPAEANEHRYARLIVGNLNGVLRAHQNLRTAHPGRFTDDDFKRIVAFAALGVPESAFKRLGAEDYWKIGLEGHDALTELSTLAPEATGAIKKELLKAPAPFRWLAQHDPDTVTEALLLSAILAQHFPQQWHATLALINPSLAQLGEIPASVLTEAAPKLVALDPEQARHDLDRVERDLDGDTLGALLLDQMRLTTAPGFAEAIERERYSTLIRSLALFAALDNLLGQPDSAAQRRVQAALAGPQGGAASGAFVELRQSKVWDNLKRAYLLAQELQELRGTLDEAVREAAVKPSEEQSFAYYWGWWNRQRLNQIEVTVSDLKRRLETAELLPRQEASLPPYFGKALRGMQQRITLIYDEVYRQLDALNQRFQAVVARQFPAWVAGEDDVILTSQFIGRALKPHWDPQTEKAVVFVFDGMRYDIWARLLRPLLEERMEVLDDAMASSLLPSETHISRWALAAGATPSQFYPRRAENLHLKDALARGFNYTGPVQAFDPQGAGIGETVRYRAGNLDYYIFEFFDKEMHNITMKSLPGGRQEPSRPLAMVYAQLQNFLETEVMAIMRTLAPGTKVFITSDHGFGPIRDQPLWFQGADLNTADDCKYRVAWLCVPFNQADLPEHARQNMIAFTPDQLGMPRRETYKDRLSGQTETKEYKAIAFPKVGYAFSRSGSAFKPSGYSHGGISLQELMIPMVTLRVRPQDESLLALGQISGPKQPLEGEEMVFRMPVSMARRTTLWSEDDIKVTAEASYSRDPDRNPLPPQTYYISAEGAEVVYRFRADRGDATDAEICDGSMERMLTISVSYHEGWRVTRKAQTFDFTVQLNTERVARRVPPSLGSIMGMMPKNVG